MPKKTKLSDADLEAFLEAVKGTKPLNQDKIKITAKPPKKRTTSAQHSIIEEKFNLSENANQPLVQSEEFITHKHVSVSNKILRNLSKGQYNVEAILDLHGMTVEKARMAIDQFLQQCEKQQVKVALIIHGKGHHSEIPILKNKVNQWLREINLVLAFCSAAKNHGDRGATYVLLRRNKEENFLES